MTVARAVYLVALLVTIFSCRITKAGPKGSRYTPIAGAAEARKLIGQAKRLPRSQQVEFYLDNLSKDKLAKQTRLQLISEFARYTLVLSPLYGESKLEISQDRWLKLLFEAWHENPHTPHVSLALTQMLINRQDYKRARKVIAPYYGKHRKDHRAAAWYRWTKRRAGKSATTSQNTQPDPMVFDVVFCVITKNPKAHAAATKDQLKREVYILNQRFRTLKGEQIVRFRFKSASLYGQVKDMGCKVVALGDSVQSYDTNRYAKAYNQCKHSKVRDPHAISFYVYDSYSKRAGFADTMCHGKRNSNRPYVLIDWARLNHHKQSPEEHEMGHAFGLGHVGVLGATIDDTTNIMCSKGEKFGSGGQRNLGFTEAQTAIILYHAQRTNNRFSHSK